MQTAQIWRAHCNLPAARPYRARRIANGWQCRRSEPGGPFFLAFGLGEDDTQYFPADFGACAARMVPGNSSRGDIYENSNVA